MSRFNQTGGNTEPLPFVRKWGAQAAMETEQQYEEPPPPPMPQTRGFAAAAALTTKEEPVPYEDDYGNGSSKKAKRERDRDHSSRRSRSRSGDRDKEHKKKKSSRDSKKHKRSSRSRSGSREKGDRKKHKRSSRSRSPKEEKGDIKGTAALAASIAAAKKAAMDIASKVRGGDGPIQAEQKTSLPLQLRGSGPSQLLVKQESGSDTAHDQSFGSTGGGSGVKSETPDEGKDRKRKSRWSTAKSFVPGMPTILPSNIDDNQRQGYLLQMEIEEATRKLRQGDFVPAADVERSPSPEPIYDANGKRLNTREIRKRQELEQRRHEKIQALLRLNSGYKPPADYRAPNIRLHDKVWIPQEDHPEINFVGLLIGPRGNTLKSLEAETGAKIIIRGKGSVKEGKLGRREGPLPGEHEPLHAYITGTDHAVIKRGCDKIREIINAALLIPDGQNELRKLQLRELAVLNGTLRPEDLLGGTRCSNCGSDQHKTWECPDAQNVTQNVICTACGGAGHIARDCKNPRPGFQFDGGAGMDDEYSALMAELGEKTTTPNTSASSTFGTSSNSYEGGGGRGGYRPRYRLPGGMPIQRVNLSARLPRMTFAPPTPEQQQAFWGGEMGPPPPFFPGGGGFTDPVTGMPTSGWPSWPPPAGFPMPVPPPPGGSLSLFPPPPPPPPPPAPSAAKLEPQEHENGGSSSNDLTAFLGAPAPPPPPQG